MNTVKFPNGHIVMSGNLHFPGGFSEDRKYPVIVCAHPAGGVKEQTSGLYASKLATEGFVTRFRRLLSGRERGEPRQLENPYAQVEDISAAIDYMTTLRYVDRDRIGVLGVCAGGGYAVNATMNDRRVKALGTVSAANYGAILRNGWDGTSKNEPTFQLLEAAAKARTDEANGGEAAFFLITPAKREDAPNADLAEAHEYYHTPRAQCANAPSIGTTRSFAQLVTFDAFQFVEQFLTQPLQVVAGSDAGTLWMSEDVYERAASKDKDLLVVKGGTHVGMYDKPELVGEAMLTLGPFFKRHL